MQCFSLKTEHHITYLMLDKPDVINNQWPVLGPKLEKMLIQLHRDGLIRVLVIRGTDMDFSTESVAQSTPAATRRKTPSKKNRIAICKLLTEMHVSCLISMDRSFLEKGFRLDS